METSPRTSPKKCCKTCSVELVPDENWSKGLQASKSHLCRACNAAKGRKFYAENKRHVIETAKKLRAVKRDVIGQYWREWRSKNKERLLVHEAERRNRIAMSVDLKSRRMISACRARCKAAGIEFDLTHEWLAERLARGVCEATGIPFDFSLPSRSERKSRTPAFAPSLDRVQCGGGYTTGNVLVTVFIYNVARSDFSQDELLVLAKAITAKATQQ